MYLYLYKSVIWDIHDTFLFKPSNWYFQPEQLEFVYNFSDRITFSISTFLQTTKFVLSMCFRAQICTSIFRAALYYERKFNDEFIRPQQKNCWPEALWWIRHMCPLISHSRRSLIEKFHIYGGSDVGERIKITIRRDGVLFVLSLVSHFFSNSQVRNFAPKIKITITSHILYRVWLAHVSVEWVRNSYINIVRKVSSQKSII